MAEQDSLSGFDFDKVSKPGKFLKWVAGKPITLRILTKDPVVQEREFTNKKTGVIDLRTTFCFIVWNFTDGLAQILSVGPGMARTFQNVNKDEDFGANLQQCDIKISPDGEGLNRTYDVNVLRHSGSQKDLTKSMIEEAQQIDLDRDVQDNKGRLSKWEPQGTETISDNAPATDEPEDRDPDAPKPGTEDVVIEDIGDEPINLDDIPF